MTDDDTKRSTATRAALSALSLLCIFLTFDDWWRERPIMFAEAAIVGGFLPSHFTRLGVSHD